VWQHIGDVVGFLVTKLVKTTVEYTGAPIKNSPFKKTLYFSNGSMVLSQTFRIFPSSDIVYPANFIKATDMVQQIQQFKLSSVFQVNMQLCIEYS